MRSSGSSDSRLGFSSSFRLGLLEAGMAVLVPCKISDPWSPVAKVGHYLPRASGGEPPRQARPPACPLSSLLPSNDEPATSTWDHPRRQQPCRLNIHDRAPTILQHINSHIYSLFLGSACPLPLQPSRPGPFPPLAMLGCLSSPTCYLSS